MSLLSSSIANVRCLAEEEGNHNILQDLQLAAELGKTLLDRNKELENVVKLNHTTIEEQAQEIEYMKKQTAALREVNDSRLKIYEQLEVSIQDLERANHRLVIENSSDKKLIKSQCLTIEVLEARNEELQRKLDEINEQYESRVRQHTTSRTTSSVQTQTTAWKSSVTPDGSTQQDATGPEQEMTELLRQLQEARSQRAREQKKAADLDQQVAALLQENVALEEQINIWRSKAQDVKNLQDEINALEEVRRGHLCGRCLRGMETKTHDEISVMLDQEEYDDISMAESLISDHQRDTESISQERLATLIKKSMALNENKEFRSPLWTAIAYIWKAPTLFFLIIQQICYIKNECVIPLLLKPFRIPIFILKKLLALKDHMKLL